MSRFSSGPAPKAGGRRAVAFVMRGHLRKVTAIALTAFLGGVAEALFLITITRTAFAITDGSDRIAFGSRWHLSIGLTLLVALALVSVRIVLACYASWHSADLSTRVVAQIRNLLSDAFLDSSWEVQQAQPSGSLQGLLTGHSREASALMNNMTQGVVTAANLVALLAIAVAVNPLGAIVLVACVTVLGLFLRPLRKVVRRRAQSSAGAGMDFSISLNEVSELGLELQVFHVQRKAQARIGEATERYRQAGTRLQFATGLATPLYSGLAYIAILGALALVAASNTTSFTSLGAAMLVMLRSLSYGQAAQGAYVGVSGTLPAIEELQERLEEFSAGRRRDQGQPVGRVGAIAMQHVGFGYSPGEPVLRDISFTIAPREIVGIVGPSGAGKSTLVQLLLGLRDPDSGLVLADGRDISTFDRAEWARKVTFVPQAANLVSGTIADNIRFFRDGVTQDDVERAAVLANLHEDVQAFPERYDRQVGKNGGHLSGGQQQRLCIARALVEDAEVLILDEPTSSLDVVSEHAVRSTLLSLKERMTVIVIAHRLSTLSICDRVMVIDGGEVKDFDTPQHLERSSRFYQEALTLSGLR